MSHPGDKPEKQCATRLEIWEGAKLNFIWFRSSDPIQSYLRFKTADFICFLTIGTFCYPVRLMKGSQGYNENDKRQIPQ
jgi:hypothetical protein